MSVKYTYAISDFPNNKVHLQKLVDDINLSDITGEVDFILVEEGNCYINFTDTLSAGEISILDTIVSAHDGLPYTTINVLTVERLETFTSTASGFTSVLSLSASDVPPGEYRLLWSLVYGIDSGTVNFRMRIQQNNTITKAEHAEEVPNADPKERIPRSGFIPISITISGEYHWDIECGKEVAGEEAWKIFKAFLELRRLS